MLLNFFDTLRRYRVPVSIREHLDLLEALQFRLAFASLDDFYYLSRSVLVKDERHFDKFDKAFSAFSEGIEDLEQLLDALIPEDWLRKEFERILSKEEQAGIQALGNLEDLMKQFRERLAEQKKRHQGGNKWIGTGGTSPFGA